jgi:hypothetical protein
MDLPVDLINQLGEFADCIENMLLGERLFAFLGHVIQVANLALESLLDLPQVLL